MADRAGTGFRVPGLYAREHTLFVAGRFVAGRTAFEQEIVTMFFSQMFRSGSVGTGRRQPGHTRGRARGRQPTARKLALEPLEDRALLSTFVWENQGQPGDDSDNFGAVYGTNATAARNLVVQAMTMWGQVIGNFNYTGFGVVQGGLQGGGNTFVLTVDAEDLGEGKRGSTTSITDWMDTKPYAASITMDDAGGNAGSWFFDSASPGDSAEFTNLLNGFMATGSIGGSDFLRTIVHEIGHAVGFSEGLRIGSFLADAGVDQVDSEASLYTLTFGPPYLMTDAGGLHVYEGPPDPNYLFTAIPHDNDLMNPGRTVGTDTRQLISNFDTGILRKIYGYTIQNPTNVPSALPNLSFYAHLDTSTGVLYVNGELGDSSISPLDRIAIRRQGDSIEVDFLAVPGPIHFPFSSVSEIVVQTAVTVDGDDEITLDFSGGNPIPAGGLTFNGATGYDKLVVSGTGQPNDSIAVDGTQISVGGHTFDCTLQDVEELEIDASSWPNVGPASLVVCDTPVNLPKLTILGSDQNDLIVIERKSPSTDVVIEAGQGDDAIELAYVSFTLDDLEGGFIDVSGDLGSDVVTIWDVQDHSNNVYKFSQGGTLPGVLERNTSLTIRYDGLEDLELKAGKGDDTVYVQATVPDTVTTIKTLVGDDTILVDSNGLALGGKVNDVRSLLVVDGGGGPYVGDDVLTLNDVGDDKPNTVTVTDTRVGAASGDNFFGAGGSLEYAGLSKLTINMGRASDTIKVQSTAKGTPTTIHAGPGNDKITVAGPPDPDDGGSGSGQEKKGKGKGRKTWTVDQINSILTVHGELGTDRLTVIDTADPTGDDVTITDSTVGMGPSDTLFGPDGGLVYHTVEKLRLDLGTGHDDVLVQSTHVNTPTYVRGGDGDDDVVVKDAAGTANEIRNLLDVNGQKGYDTLILEDAAETLPTVVTVGHAKVGAGPSDDFFNGGGYVTYSGLEELTLNAGTSGDTIYVEGTAVGTETRINASDGIDLITVEYSGTVDLVRSPLTIDGGGGPTNALALIDSADATPDQVTVALSQVGAAPGDSFFGQNGSLTYLNLTQLNLVSGLAGDTINVRSTNPATKLLLGGGGGDDVFLVDSNGQAPGGTVDLIASEVTLYGGLGSNGLILDDGSDVTSDMVTLTPTGPQAGHVGLGASDDFFGPGGSLIYNELDTLVLRTSDVAPDVINVAPSPTPGGTQFAVDAQGPTFSDPPPGDRLNLDLQGVSQPKLSVLSAGIGVLDSPSHASVLYAGIEAVATLTDPAFDLVLDMNLPLLPGNDTLADLIRAYCGALASGERTLELKVNGATVFVGVEGAVNSLAVLGSGDGDEFTIVETADGLPGFPGVALGSHTNAAFVGSGLAPTNVGIHFDGGPGASTDAFALALINPHNVNTFQDAMPPLNSGVINVEGEFTLSYSSLTPLFFTGAGGLLSVDATLLREMTTLLLTDLGGGVQQISGDGGFETVTFSGFDRYTVDPPDGVRLVDTRTRGILSSAPSLDRFDARSTPTEDTRSVRIRDEWFQWLAIESAPAVLVESRLGSSLDGQSDVDVLGELSELLAEGIGHADSAGDVEAGSPYEDLVETLAPLL